jgi:hypothetical protein
MFDPGETGAGVECFLAEVYIHHRPRSGFVGVERWRQDLQGPMSLLC